MRDLLSAIELIAAMLVIGLVWLRYHTEMPREAALCCYVGFAACLGALLGSFSQKAAFGAMCASAAIGVAMVFAGLARLLVWIVHWAW